MKKKLVVALLAVSLASSSMVYAGEDKKEDVKTEETVDEEADEETDEEADAKEDEKADAKEDEKADAKEDEKADAKEDEEADAEEDKKEEIDEKTYRLVSLDADAVAKAVTLSDYKGMSLEKTTEEVTGEMVDERINTILEENMISIKDEGAAAENGDVANINYVGSIDGEEFAGGSAEKYDLELGSGSFIDGFEEGVEGMKVGETKDVTVTFPEEYPSEDVAGKEAVFKVTLNEIKRKPELTEDWVKENTDSDSVDGYKADIRKELEDEKAQNQEDGLLQTALASLTGNSEIKEYPEEDMEAMRQRYKDEIELYAQEYGMDLESLLEQQGMTEDDFEEQCQQYAEYCVKQSLIIQAVMDREEMNFASEQADVMKVKLASMMNMPNFTQLVEEYGVEPCYNSLGYLMVGQFIIDNADIKEKAAEKTDEEEPEEALSPESEEDAKTEEAADAKADETEEAADNTSEEEDTTEEK